MLDPRRFLPTARVRATHATSHASTRTVTRVRGSRPVGMNRLTTCR